MDLRLGHRHRRDNPAGTISFGAFLILIAIIYLTTPNLLGEASAFIHDLKPVQISQNFWLLEPSTNHPILYNAAQQFCYLFGLVQVIILGLKFTKHDSVRQEARTFSDIIFWVGSGYVFGVLSTGTLAWISFLGALVVLIGVSIIVQTAVFLVTSRH